MDGPQLRVVLTRMVLYVADWAELESSLSVWAGEHRVEGTNLALSNLWAKVVVSDVLRGENG